MSLTSSLRELRALIIRDVQTIENEGLQSLAALISRRRQLRVLDMSGCRRFTDEGLLVLLQSAGGIVEELSLARCLQITNLGLMPLRGRAHRGKLAVLNLDGLTRPSDTSATWLAEGPGGQLSRKRAGTNDGGEGEGEGEGAGNGAKEGKGEGKEKKKGTGKGKAKGTAKPKTPTKKKKGKGKPKADASGSNASGGGAGQGQGQEGEGGGDDSGPSCKLGRLRSLRMVGWTKLTDLGLMRLTAVGPTLHSLNLKDCLLITGSGVAAVVAAAPVLRTLNLSGCVAVDDHMAAPLTSAAYAARARMRAPHDRPPPTAPSPPGTTTGFRLGTISNNGYNGYNASSLFPGSGPTPLPTPLPTPHASPHAALGEVPPRGATPATPLLPSTPATPSRLSFNMRSSDAFETDTVAGPAATGTAISSAYHSSIGGGGGGGGGSDESADELLARRRREKELKAIEEDDARPSCRGTLTELNVSGVPKLSDTALAAIVACCHKLTIFR